MSIDNCRKCEWFQPFHTDDYGHTRYACAWTKKCHHWMLDCPKYARRTKRGGL